MVILSIVMFIFSFILGLFFSITGLAGVRVILKYRICCSEKGWPSVRGTILTSTVIETQSEGDYGVTHYNTEANIGYQYQVGGKNYVAKDPRFDLVTQNICDLVEEHPIGKEVDVFYNPKNPQDSRLKGYARIDWLNYFIGTPIALAVGAVCIYVAFYVL